MTHRRDRPPLIERLLAEAREEKRRRRRGEGSPGWTPQAADVFMANARRAFPGSYEPGKEPRP